MKTAFVTDSGTGKSVAQLQEKGIFSVPLQIGMDQHSFHDLEDITLAEVNQKMKEGHMLTTSLPALGKIEELFSTLKEQGYERIFAVPICTGLSGTTNAMKLCAEQLGIVFEYVDCHVTAIVQEYLITKAKKMYDAQASIEEIKQALETIVHETNTLILPDDLHHLKRGGRLTPLAATLGGLLKIKPILQINEKTQGKIDVLDKVRTMSKAMDKVVSIMQAEGVNEHYDITVAHVESEEQGQLLLDKIAKAFPNATLHLIPLVSVVGVHTGLGSLALQYFPLK